MHIKWEQQEKAMQRALSGQGELILPYPHYD